jgi:serine/threonine protein phosphatase PrpC
LQVEHAEVSLVGAREENQDRVAVVAQPAAALIGAFDGMGGHADGARAAEIARKTLVTRFAALPQPLLDPLAFLHLALGYAHAEIVEIGMHLPLDQRPRATGAVCVLQDETAWFAHVGDSRIYHLRAGKVLSRTRDHSHVELLLQEGLINANQAVNHPMRNFVESCLGGDPLLPEMHIGRTVRVQPGDILLVCTDGFWSYLSDDDIANSLYTSAPLQTALQAISEFAVKRGGNAADNTSVAVLRVQ